jgi:hypothetical protein
MLLVSFMGVVATAYVMQTIGGQEEIKVLAVRHLR